MKAKKHPLVEIDPVIYAECKLAGVCIGCKTNPIATFMYESYDDMGDKTGFGIVSMDIEFCEECYFKNGLA